jgi:hypothetical protein
LAFVVDNWWINPIRKKDKIVYIVAALTVDDNEEEDSVNATNSSIEEIEELGEKMSKMEKMILDLGRELKNIDYKVTQIYQQK